MCHRPLSLLWTVLLGLLLPGAGRAEVQRHPADATLRAVQLVDADEGWAVGDDGVILHTIDAGKTWETQKSGTTASLRSVYFLDAYVGWIAGREELPYGGGSAGVLLFTRDGGLKWQRVLLNTLPGLNRVRFVDGKTGYLLGDSSEVLPTGVFKTSDGGRTWQPLKGPRSPAWLDGDFTSPDVGAVAGAWSRLGTLKQTVFTPAEIDALGGRSVHALRMLEGRALAVGQGGLVLSSQSGGASWGFAATKLPVETLANWDFYALDSVGECVWVVGRPGSALLRSVDGGLSWNVCKTGQPLPLHGVFFLDRQHGWAVGELGTILTTADAGTTWQVQRSGGKRAPVLAIHAQTVGVPLETLAQVGAADGYLTASLSLVDVDPQSAAAAQASNPARFQASLRTVGGAAGETLWQFPLPQHLGGADKEALLEHWNKRHGGRASQEIVRQLVLALRMWRPAVVLTDHPESTALGSLVAEAAHEAFKQAADPRAFPEQLTQLGLQPWSAARLYSIWDKSAQAHVTIDAAALTPRLQATLRDYALGAAALVQEKPALPRQRHYRLVASRGEGAADQRTLLGGIHLKTEDGGTRVQPEEVEVDPAFTKALQARQQLQILVEQPTEGLNDPSKLLGQLLPALRKLPHDQGVAALLEVANQYVRAGQWELARESYLLLVDRYPTHPLAADAYRWLVRHNSSSEARRRHELKQFLAVEKGAFQQANSGAPLAEDGTQAPGMFVRKGQAEKPIPGQGRPQTPRPEATELLLGAQVTVLSNLEETRTWYRGSLEMGKRLDDFGPLYRNDPAIYFAMQSARRQLGDFAGALAAYKAFAELHTRGPWQESALAEMWLSDRAGKSAKPMLTCRRTQTRPHLDGQFDDACWDGLASTVLQPAHGELGKEYTTEARFTHDEEFLYVALRCTHPADKHVPPLKRRQRDADLTAFDRVSIVLDLDRDYGTYFQLCVDQRGCVCEDCWGDRTWNPKWFVAMHSTSTAWQAELAIPLIELTGHRVSAGSAWACNVVRIVPRRGVQAFALPADVQPRPEGLGLLLFQEDPRSLGRPPAAQR